MSSYIIRGSYHPLFSFENGYFQTLPAYIFGDVRGVFGDAGSMVQNNKDALSPNENDYVVVREIPQNGKESAISTLSEATTCIFKITKVGYTISESPTPRFGYIMNELISFTPNIGGATNTQEAYTNMRNLWLSTASGKQLCVEVTYFSSDLLQAGGDAKERLRELLDVQIANPADGNALVYNSSTQLWQNGAIRLESNSIVGWAGGTPAPVGEQRVLVYARTGPGINDYAFGPASAGANIDKFVDLTDVSIEPAAGAVVHYDANISKWVQSGEINIDNTTRNVAIVTTGDIGIQAPSGTLVLDSGGDASITSTLGNTNVASLTNSVQITSGLATTIDAGGDISLTTTGLSKTIRLESAQNGSSIIFDSPEVTTSNSAVTVTMTGVGVSTISGWVSTELGIENNGSVTNIRGDEINVICPQSGCAFIPQVNVESILTIETENKSASQYALDIASHPEAVPNVQFVLDNVSAGDIKIGGQGPASTLIFGTTNTQDLNVIRNSQPILFTSTVPDRTTLQSTTGGLLIESANSLTVNSVLGASTISGDAGVNLTSGDNVTIVAPELQINDSVGTRFTVINGRLTAAPGYEALIDADDVLTSKLYVDTEIATTALTLANKSLVDSSTYLVDNLDPTKRLQFQLAGLTTGATRTLTVPDSDGTILLSTIGPIVQNGNTLGTTMSIGTNDAFDVYIRRQGANLFNFNSTGLTFTAAPTFFIRGAGAAALGVGVAIVGGSPTSGSSFAGGSISLTGGNAFATGGNAAAAGSVSLSGGTSIRTNGGAINLTGGTCSDGSTAGLTGGPITLTSGSCSAVGRGGDIVLTASSSTYSSTIGAGNIFIRCTPMVGTGTRAGGVVIIQASPSIGGAAGGYVRLLYNTTQGFTVEEDGTLSTNTPLYQNLITLDNDIPNRKFTVDRIDAQVTPTGELVFGGTDPLPILAASYQLTYTLANTWYEVAALATLSSNNASFILSGTKFATNNAGRLQWLGPTGITARVCCTLDMSTSGGNADEYEFALCRNAIVSPFTAITGTVVRNRFTANAEYQVLTFSKVLTLTNSDSISIIARSTGTGRILSVINYNLSVMVDKMYQ